MIIQYIMDSDLLFALGLEANEYDIEDEQLIEKLATEFTKNNYNDIGKYIDDKFGIGYNEDEFKIEHNLSQSLITKLKSMQHITRYELTVANTIQHNFPAGIIPTNNGFIIPVQNMGGMSQLSGILGGTVGNAINNLLGQLNQEPVHVALTPQALDQLAEMSYAEMKERLPNLDDDENCSICCCPINEDTDNQVYTVLPCNHVFHSTCVKDYLKEYSYHCPICKAECGEHEAKL